MSHARRFVLVVEDNPDHALLVKLALARVDPDLEPGLPVDSVMSYGCRQGIAQGLGEELADAFHGVLAFGNVVAVVEVEGGQRFAG